MRRRTIARFWAFGAGVVLAAGAPAAAAEESLASEVVALGASDPAARARAAYRLKRAGAAAAPVLASVAAHETSLGRRAREILDFVKGDGAEWGAWLARFAAAPPDDAAARAQAATPFARRGAAAIPFLFEALVHDEDPAARAAARTLLLEHCRYTVEATLAWTASFEGVGCVVSGRTDLPEGTALACWVYAVFGEGEEAPKRYVWGDGARVEKGAFRVTFDPEPLAPGTYELQVEVEPDVREPGGVSRLLLDPGTEDERWVGGADRIGASARAVLGTPEEIARERLTGPARVKAAIARLGALYGTLASRALWMGLPAQAAGGVPAPLAAAAESLASGDPIRRAQARRDLAALDPEWERQLWSAVGARCGAEPGLWERVAATLQRDWEAAVSWTGREVSLRRNLPGRDDRVMATVVPYAASAAAAERLGEGLAALGRRLMRDVVSRGLPPAPPGAAPADGVAPAGGGEAPPTLEAWLASYQEAMGLYAEDRLQAYLTVLARVEREAGEAAAMPAGGSPDTARAAWRAAASRWERDLARLAEDWSRETALPDGAGAFDRKVASFLKERVPDFDALLSRCRAVLEAREAALGDAARLTEAERAATAFREAVETRRAAVRDGVVTIGMARVNLKTREVEIDAVVNMKEGLTELLVSTPDGKLHEALLVAEGRPSDLYYALLRLGLRPGGAPRRENAARRPPGDLVDVWVEWRETDGWRRVPAEHFLENVSTGRPIERRGWVFLGSEFLVETDPVTGDPITYFMANALGSVATASAGYVTSTVLDSTLRLGYGEVVARGAELPPVGAPVRLRVKPIPPAEAKEIRAQMEADARQSEGAAPPQGQEEGGNRENESEED